MPGAEVGDGLTDEELATRAAAGGDHAFAALVDRHQAGVYRLARLLVGRDDLAEDVLQQTFVSAWRAIGSFRGEASVRTWLYTIARHAAWKARAAQADAAVGGLETSDLEALGLAAGWGRDNPEEQAIRAEARAQLRAAFAVLSAEDREILTLRDLEGLSGDEAARLLGVGLPAMKSRLHRARLRLAAVIRKEGGHAAGRA